MSISGIMIIIAYEAILTSHYNLTKNLCVGLPINY